MKYSAFTPAIMSSFVGFGTFPTSLFSSFKNVGLILSIVLILLLIYLELTEHLKVRNYMMIGGLRISVSRLSAILFVIFIGMVFTKMVNLI